MSTTSDLTFRRTQLREEDYIVPQGRLCDYGCKRQASFILMTKDNTEKFCCSRRYQKCPARQQMMGSPRHVDLKDRTFNHLTAKKPLGKSKCGSMKWLCLCSCGKYSKVDAGDLVHNRVKSCGHIFYHGKSKTVEYMLYHAAKARARKRKLPFTIILSDVVIPPMCPILEIPIQHHTGILKGDSPSLERLYPSRGYIPGNIIVISHKANRMKGENTPEELISLGNKFKRLYETIC